MNICIISPYYMPSIGGMEIVTHNLSKELCKAGHSVSIVTFTPMNDFEGSVCSVYRLPTIINPQRPLLKIFSRTLLNLFYIPYIASLLCHLHPDIVQVQNTSSVVYAYLPYLIKKIPYCISNHGSQCSRTPIALNPLTKNIWGYLPYIKAAKKCFSLTYGNSLTIQNELHLPQTVIPNGIDYNIFNCDFRHNDYLNITHNPTIITVSRLEQGKGLNLILLTLSEIIKISPRVTLIIVGDGSLLPMLQQQVKLLNIEKSVTFTGWLSPRDTSKYYQKSHVYLSLSDSEGFGLTIIEAMACGIPIVSTRVGVASEIIHTKINGVLVDTKDAKIIATEIISILSDYSYFLRISENNKLIAKSYTWGSIAQQYLTEYDRILTSCKGV